jgi:hypothetical protein
MTIRRNIYDNRQCPFSRDIADYLPGSTSRRRRLSALGITGLESFLTVRSTRLVACPSIHRLTAIYAGVFFALAFLGAGIGCSQDQRPRLRHCSGSVSRLTLSSCVSSASCRAERGRYSGNSKNCQKPANMHDPILPKLSVFGNSGGTVSNAQANFSAHG